MIRNALIACVVLSAMTVACGDLPQPVVPGNTPTNTQTQTKTLKPDVPTLTTRTPSFGYLSMPLRGSAEKDANVIVEGGAAPTAIDVGATGNFCVDVALHEGSNKLKIYAQRVDGSRSDTVSYTVTYDPSLIDEDTGDTAPTQQTGQVRDVAQRKALGASVSATSGGDKITDADDGTYATFTAYPSLYIDLGQAYAVQKIDIVWAASATTAGTYADEYDLFSSLQTSPTRPMDTSTSGWSVIAQVTGASGGNGDGDTDTFEVGTPITARWIGLTVNSNNTSWYSFDWSVNIASIRVYAPEIITDGGGTGVVGPPTCENAGY